eukprot:scaffold671337_cov50-Prasinocladus_malaysianus.AAC.2
MCCIATVTPACGQQSGQHGQLRGAIGADLFLGSGRILTAERTTAWRPRDPGRSYRLRILVDCFKHALDNFARQLEALGAFRLSLALFGLRI